MAVLDRYLSELEVLSNQVAREGLTSIPDGDKNAFGYGRAAGRLEGIQLAEQLLKKVIHDQEERQRVAGRANTKAREEE